MTILCPSGRGFPRSGAREKSGEKILIREGYSQQMLGFNENVRLIITDVDDTVSRVYRKTDPKLIFELENLLSEGKSIVFTSGQSFRGIHERITSLIAPDLRKRCLLVGCLGAEINRFDPKTGELVEKPVFSLYGKVSARKRGKWREIVKQIVLEFDLKIFPIMPPEDFVRLTKGRKNSAMIADRGPQITFELPNDTEGLLKARMKKRAELLLKKAGIPARPTLGGVSALDLRLDGASKELAVRKILSERKFLKMIGLEKREMVPSEERIEIWGDRFEKGLPDSEISLAVPRGVRSIDFRDEDRKKFPKGRKIVFWDGKKRLSLGLLEYLKNRKKRRAV